MNRIINIHRLVLIFLTIVMGASSAWAQTTITKSTWDGTVPSTVNVSKAECNRIGITGSGTEADPYVISTAGQFAYFVSKMNGNTNWWKLKENIEIDLNGATHVWTYGQSNANFKGHFDGNGSTISNMKFETNAANKNYGIFPQLQGSSATDHAYIKNLTIKNCKITAPDSGTSYGKTTLTGILVGKAAGNTDIENVTISGCSIAYDVTTTDANYVGALVGSLTGDNNTVKKCTVNSSKENSVETPTAITAGTAQKKNFYVGGLVGYADSNSLVTGNTVTASITLDGETSGNNYIGGLIGYAKGGNSTVSSTLPMGKRVVVKGNTATPTITMNGQVVTANFVLGGLFGYADNHVNIVNNKVAKPTISVTNNIKNATYIGGAIGYMNAYSYADGMTVNGGSISGPTSDKTVTNNIVFFVGGFLGYQVSSGTGVFQANKFKSIAVTDMNINLGYYVPAGQIKDHKFSVGGIAGSVNAPNMKADGTWGGMPENLIFKGGKIYAPWASTSPIVGNFSAAAATHQNMTLDMVITVDAIEKAKAKTWYYNDYKLGLSSAFLSNTNVIAENAQPEYLKFRKNYSKATETIDGIQYLSIDNSTLTRSNRYQDSERDLKTVLWWTQQASMDQSKSPATVAAVTCFTANEQPIYPQSGAASTAAGNLIDYPYYMYFFQGVGNAKYASNTDAANIVKGIEANFTNDVMPAVAMSSETNLNVTITNEGETRRGFDDRTLSVTVKQGSTDATSNYTYQWYLDGKADGTGTTKTLTPHWKDGQGITVNVLSGSTIVATTSYGFAPGMLHTKASAANATAELVRSDYNNRGTSTNPYIIDCESALRQLSYLSTVHTSMFWETLGKPASPYPTCQSQGHYDRAYYELSADIDLGGREFIPISHVGYGGDGSWGTYNQNWIFQGVFDGKEHKISNLKITWGAGQYSGNNANIYYGLFGCVGNNNAACKWGDTDNSNTVIKNLIIDGATLTHDPSNTTFYYNSTNGNYCMVGVLAGIVTSNTTIQNIEIRNSKITDASSQNYSLATKGLYVGGAIGSFQTALNKTDGKLAGSTIQHIAAQVDITLTKPTFVDPSAKAQVNQFNIGGIIGRYISTGASQDEAQLIMPAYTIYSGTVNAPKAWISPVIGATRFTDQNGNEFKHYSKQWEGNNNSADTQISITNALYYNFYIGSTKITESVPSNICTRGARSMSGHADGSESALSYSAQKYQGVNYEARYINLEGASLALLNESAYEDIHWVWDNGFAHMSTDPYVEATLTRVDNTFTAGLVGGTPVSYSWEASFDGDNWISIPSASAANYIAYPSLKPKYIVALVNDGTKDYRTVVELVQPDYTLIHPVIANEGNTYRFELNSKAPDGQMTTTYEWYETKDTPFSPAVINTDITLTDAQIAANDGVVWCKVNVTELGVTMYEDLMIAGATVIYVNGDNYKGNGAQPGDDNNDGQTPQTPVLTIDKANSLLKSKAEGGTWDKNIIVVMGVLDPDFVFQSTGSNPATLTGKWNGIDYEGVIRLDQINPIDSDENGNEHIVNPVHQPGKKGANCYVLHDTKFENLTFYGNQKGNTFIECHGNDVTFGKGLVMTNFKKLSDTHGNFGNNELIPEFTIILTATNLCAEDIALYTKNRTKPQVLTIQSGHYGRVMGGRFTQNFFSNNDNTAHSILASAEDPLWAVINIEIDDENPKTDGDGKTGPTTYTCDINGLIAGLTDGSIWGDYEINVRGGSIVYVVGGNQGNPVKNGTATCTPVDGTEGDWGQWPNATFFGRTVINIDQDPALNNNINIGNLYAGSLGRMLQATGGGSVVDMYIYGHTEVNMIRGTITGSMYGGGAGGVVGSNPWDLHIPYATDAADNAPDGIQHKVQYGKFGSAAKSDGDPLATVNLHKLKDDGTYEIEPLNLANSSTTLHVIGGTINGNVYGGGYGFVDNMPLEVTMQGVGSVFGTTNLNITGGTINGNVYGGSQGHTKYYGAVNNYGQTITHIAETNGTVNLNITGTDAVYPVISGTIYGAGQGIASVQKTATQADVDAGKATNVGDTFYEEYSRIATAGNTDLGDKYKTNINITIDMPESVTFPNDIYGGGAMGLVDGTTNIVLKRGTFTGSIYGGGYGELQHLDKAMVTGTTNISTGATDVTKVDQNVPVTLKGSTMYGGGDMAQVKGNTYINVNHGNVTANVFGGGRGLTQSQSGTFTDYGKVTGDTRVWINNQTTGNTFTGNIYGGGALGAVQGNTQVVVKAGEIDGNVFGGGQGEEGSEKAKVTGNADVIVDGNWTEPTPEP